QPGTAKVIAPEVVAIEFAYWDGLEWLESWDSASSGTLPSAIGITLSIDTESTVEGRTLSGQLQQSGVTAASAEAGEPVQVRYVIALPLAEPYVSEASICCDTRASNITVAVFVRIPIHDHANCLSACELSYPNVRRRGAVRR